MKVQGAGAVPPFSRSKVRWLPSEETADALQGLSQALGFMGGAITTMSTGLLADRCTLNRLHASFPDIIMLFAGAAVCFAGGVCSLAASHRLR